MLSPEVEPCEDLPYRRSSGMVPRSMLLNRWWVSPVEKNDVPFYCTVSLIFCMPEYLAVPSLHI
ncbi:hypothetical protein Hanom_Chr13g01209241 [Helianthus anomalus]